MVYFQLRCMLHSNTNEEQYKKHVSALNPVDKENTVKKEDHSQSQTICTIHNCKLIPCIVSEKNWNTKLRQR